MNIQFKISAKELLSSTAAALFVSCVFAGDVLAAGDAAEVEGLPQLDFTTYTPQLFWMFAFFAVLYMFFAMKTLPEISGVIENRKNHIQSDLETAEKLAAEADQVQEAYQASLVKAQDKAAKAIQDVESDMKKAAEDAAEEFRVRSEKEIKAAEAEVLKAQDAVMDEVNTIAAEAASEAVSKIIGAKTDIKKAKTIIEGLADKAKAA
ncbi:MAG: hypothetical protein HRT94_09145 [Alphaproteobacteria bacterium]|nr:hypothetical protein [Alphaproteobacteria bacterium]